MSVGAFTFSLASLTDGELRVVGETRGEPRQGRVVGRRPYTYGERLAWFSALSSEPDPAIQTYLACLLGDYFNIQSQPGDWV